MKGAASSLYGSGAAAGVISTKKKLEESNCWKCAYECGTKLLQTGVNYRPRTTIKGLSVNGNVDKFNIMLL
jgi:vitamin B12 transporter